MISATGKYGPAGCGGFTLIELVVVLAILVGLTMAFPIAMERLQPERQLHVYAQRIASELREQRSLALQGNQVTGIVAASKSQSYRMLRGAADTRLPGGLSIALYPAGRPATAVPTLEFFPDGSSSGGFVQLSREDHHARILVTAFTGKVTVE